MNLTEKLLQLGFSKNEATVYQSLIQLGQCKASAIIKDTDLHRNIVYEALDELVERKLAFKTSKGGVAFFQLSDANTLVQEAEQTLSTAEQVAKEINHSRETAQHEVKLYEGAEGLKALREKAIADLEKETDPTKRELLVLGVGKKITQDYYESIFKKDDEKRAARQIPARLLFPRSLHTYAERIAKTPLTETKFLPESMKDPTVIDIWKDNVAFMMHDVEPFIVSIKNQKLADSFREYFETLWNQDTHVITGRENVEKLIHRKLDELKPGDTYSVYGGQYGEKNPDYFIRFWREYHKKRNEKGVHLNLIGFQHISEQLTKEVHTSDPSKTNSTLRFLNQELLTPTLTLIYPHSALMILWDYDEAMAIETMRESARVMLKKHFDALWDIAKE